MGLTRKQYAILNANKRKVKQLCDNELPTCSGIYLFYRLNEKGEKCVYVGQAKCLVDRCASHLTGRKTHIDKSLYLHKLYSEDNEFGWKLKVICKCCVNDLDMYEKYYINYYKEQDYKIYNVTGGGQTDKAQDIGERLQTKVKSYKNGKGLGYNKAKNYVKNLFDKYLGYSIKGKPNKVKERKLREFKEWLEVQNGEVKES